MFPPLIEILSKDALGFIDRSIHQFIISNEQVIGASDKSLNVVNPANEETITQIYLADKDDVDKAVKSAKSAFTSKEWKSVLPNEREKLLHRLADLIEENADTIAQIITLENGKPVKEAKQSEVMGAVKTFRYYAGWCTKIEGSTLDLSIKQPSGKQNFAYIKKEPIGVVAAVIPWNTPFSIASWKLAPALAAGCTVVLKPSEVTPLNALFLGQLIVEAGFPPGVVNIITGDGTTGAALVAHPLVDKVTFTGSTEIGKIIGRSAMTQATDVSLEMGGKSPAIVFDDADLTNAAQGVAKGIFRNMGQICVSGSRVYIQRKSFDKVMADIVAEGEKMKISHGFDPDAQLGPLVSKQHLDHVCGYIDKGQSNGARLISGGKRPFDKGYFLQPTVFTAEDNDQVIIAEEIFGPVLVGIPFDDIEDVIEKANDSIYGLSSSVFTRDITKALRMVDELESGWVWINSPARSDPNFPLGGYKESGIGKELGRPGLDTYLKQKAVNIVF